MPFVLGYLPSEDVCQLASAYSTVYNLGLDEGSIMAAVNMAKSVDIRNRINELLVSYRQTFAII